MPRSVDASSLGVPVGEAIQGALKGIPAIVFDSGSGHFSTKAALNLNAEQVASLGRFARGASRPRSWRDAGLPWSLSVGRVQGVASLCLPGWPEQAPRWDEHLQAFETAFAHWAQRLEAEPAALAFDAAWCAALGGGHWPMRA